MRGVKSLIACSDARVAKRFKRWFYASRTREPSGSLSDHERDIPCTRESLRDSLSDVPLCETHLHYRLVSTIRERYGATLMLVVQGGELQDTKAKRESMWKKGYAGGQPDIMITNPHGTYSGLCIELKIPRGTGNLSTNQIDVLSRYRKMGWKIIVSNNLTDILSSLEEYVKGLV